MYDIIRKKREGEELSREEIFKFIKGYTKDQIPDYQAAALLMAISLNSMTNREISDLTDAMASSGDCIDLSVLGGLSVDKHSTGGVGDKTSLIAIPIAASLGCKVAKMSGRGLGYTGGTIDKLESIPGYKTQISAEKLLRQAEDTGIALASQSGNLTPADKKLYALRDVTATVDSIPLIASSIMSKKIAAGSKNIVLDVKVGSGAFMKNTDDARKLAQCMVDIGERAGRNVRALITNMDIPLGNAIGNCLEVIESIEILKGNGDRNLLDLCIILAAHMTSMALGIDIDDALLRAYKAVESGKALRKFTAWIEAQGGDTRVVEDYSLFKSAAFKGEVTAERSGYISHMDSGKIGSVCADLGGGRRLKEDSIDHAAGITLAKKTGQWVEKGEVVASLYTNNENALDAGKKEFLKAVKITDKKPVEMPLVYEVVK